MSTSRYSAKAHQRDRQALFSAEDLSKSPSPISNVIPKLSSPYEKSTLPSYSVKASTMAQLEEQGDETMNEMKYKLSALKDLSLAMGEEINKSKKTIVEFSEDMGLTSEKIKWNMNRMRLFVEKSGVSWKIWLGFITIIFWIFFWVWLF
ncbi:hypothetical protein CANINC_001116 [Pichia inconspicua]|uniref:t-SNARE coiled-coil homology domain-containing protein n=1 Tax=Pichia inconspicua TaxID=52247 RepID=A0A4T0X481_9ASCO|nr:hypothetical protein CANINC_001116 [[Candida] inconspicua]